VGEKTVFHWRGNRFGKAAENVMSGIGVRQDLVSLEERKRFMKEIVCGTDITLARPCRVPGTRSTAHDLLNSDNRDPNVFKTVRFDAVQHRPVAVQRGGQRIGIEHKHR
jgi:hypothetical protein